MQKWLIYLISGLIALCMAFLLLRSFIPSTSSSVATTKTNEKEVSYTSPSTLWKVSFLGEPKYSTNVFRDDLGLPTVTVEGASLDQDKELYAVRLYHYHDQHQIDLPSFLDNIVASWTKKFPSLKLMRQNQTKFQGKSALSFTLAGENLEMLGVIFQIENDFYLINWVGNMNNKELEKVGEDHFNTFLNSFEALPPQ